MPINKATIMPRGPTLGHVSMLPENDRWSETRAQLLAQMDLIFGDDYITTGASSDFDGETKIAKTMVTRFGMNSFTSSRPKRGAAARRAAACRPPCREWPAGCGCAVGGELHSGDQPGSAAG
uniref:Peptidase M41 domain-containing protein n=1 Tax=Salarias fasciatus TaxID=181472 RepID=A0A672FXR0_SALFA